MYAAQAKNATQQTKAATQKYANAAENKAKEAHDSLATATAKGVDEAHTKASRGVPQNMLCRKGCSPPRTHPERAAAILLMLHGQRLSSWHV